MNKKLIAAAVFGAMFTPVAMAQSANPVTLYGLLDLTFESVKAKGGATPIGSRTRVTNQASRLGVRGSEDLGGGIKAFFQIESQINPDDACGQGGNPATGTLPNGGCNFTGNNGKGFASRNSAVGFQGDFGSVLIGRWDTPYKLATIGLDPTGDVTMGAYTTVMHDSGNFDRRENNAVQYWSPNINGFNARLHYSASEAKTQSTNPTTFSGSLTYTAKNFSVAYAYERQSNQAGSAAAASQDANGNELGISFTQGAFKFGVMLEKIRKTATADKNAFFVSASMTQGMWNPYVSFGRFKDGGAVTATSDGRGAAARAFLLGANYKLSARTNLYGQVVRITNNDKAAANFGLNGLGGVAADNDPSGFGVGVKHTF
jgi:predicted porin